MQRESKQMQFIVNLHQHAETTQFPLLSFLKQLNVNYKPFWISNFIQVQSNQSVAQIIANHQQVIKLEPNEDNLILTTPHRKHTTIKETLDNDYPWQIKWMNIPSVWDMGFYGDQIVIASADTGVQWNHPALINKYRGYDMESGNANHNFNWWDAIHDARSSNYCGSNSIEPCDDQGHGTHTTGSSVGSIENENENYKKFGVAPHAQFIGCRNMENGKGTPSSYLECLQFFLAPTDLEGKNFSPSKRPHVIINSYDCPDSEGCTDTDILKQSIQNIVNAGIFMSAAAGNTGPSCSSITNPPAIYEESFTVGGSDYNSNFVASFSSRGPVSNSNVLKPDLIAPASQIYSSFPTDNYLFLSGTSMAAPQVAGVIALIYSANPTFIRDIQGVREILVQSAFSIPNSHCGNSTVSVPNYIYGYGMISPLDSVILALNSTSINTVSITYSVTPSLSISSLHPSSSTSPSANPSSLFPYYSLSDSGSSLDLESTPITSDTSVNMLSLFILCLAIIFFL